MSSSELSRLYQALECQHHLVQDHHGNVPTIPGLTPVGFERWMTLLILAWPDEEVERLQKTVLDMPISNADDPKERFPKEIRRRLFPRESDRKVQLKLERAFPTEAREQSRTAKKDHPRGNESSGLGSTLERERQPYSVAPSPSAMHDQPLKSERGRQSPTYSDSSTEAAAEEPSVLPTNIERERKPYVARPGGGKEYSDPASSTTTNTSIPQRANSTSTRPTPMMASGGGVGGGLEPPRADSYRHHRASISGVNQPTATTRNRRGHSPSVSSMNDFRRSDNDLSLGGGGGNGRGRERERDRDRERYPAPDLGDATDDQRRWARRAPLPHDEIFSPPPPHSQHYQQHQYGGVGGGGGQQDHAFDTPRDRERFDRLVDGGSYGGGPPGNGYDYPPTTSTTGGYPPGYR